ncbi:hypothetical protein ACFSCX_13010 [Bacillus salitolerans]|uniref:Uncharacterized protein n=1 Tax=Bacillus salitolerans TaxID=1437434 RepID=A0ABW4LQN9_9BACI
MGILTILLTLIQFSILFYLFFKVKSIAKIVEQHQVEQNEMIVLLKKINEK